jgi:hypothetical protein
MSRWRSAYCSIQGEGQCSVTRPVPVRQLATQVVSMQPPVPLQLIVPPWWGHATEAVQAAIHCGACGACAPGRGAKIASRSPSSAGEAAGAEFTAAKLVAANRNRETDNTKLLSERIETSSFWTMAVVFRGKLGRLSARPYRFRSYDCSLLSPLIRVEAAKAASRVWRDPPGAGALYR